MIELTDETFHETVSTHEGLILVDFYAEWCGPCKTVMPVLEQLEEHEDFPAIAKANVDDTPDIVAEIGMRGVPTFVLFKDGVQKGMISGGQTKKSLIDFVLENK